ncbi:MAG TPA: glycosyltransferase family 4 protein [Steroidobacteraceae bacterium]|nr:glycosyltransferase family 4 protein [Steroidobacteraceae bacterium]
MQKRAKLLFNVNVAWFFISHRLEIACAARDSGFEVHIASDLESPEEAAILQREGLAFHRVRLIRGGMTPLRDLMYLRQLERVMKVVRPVLVHNVTVKPVIYGTVAARKVGVSGIVNAVAGLGYAFSPGESRKVLSTILRAAYKVALDHPEVRVIFQNEDDLETLAGAKVIDRRQAVLIRGSGVDLEKFAFVPEPPGLPIVVMPARMLRDKGVLEFAGAAQILRKQGVAARFLLAGKIDRANRAGLRPVEISVLERETGVEWLGHVSDMATLLRSSHIVCLPSYYGEGLPKSLLEACAAGKPIVTTDVPGCRDAVRHGENGLLVEPRSAEAVAGALAKLLMNYDLRMSMGVAGRRRAEDEFGLPKVVQRTLDLYRSMMV